MSIHDINKAYVSPDDKFFYQFDRDHEKSPSQLKEINKHKRIAYLRDHAEGDGGVSEIWEDF